MSGIVFLATRCPDEIKSFYLDRLGCLLWLEQDDCRVFKHGNLILGFCERERVDREGIFTFFFRTRAEVDARYEELRAEALAPPKAHPKYRIYQFFARDPEGRMLEFQSFDHRIDAFLDGAELLQTRRSIRDFAAEPVPQALLDRVFELCRFAPTSRNSQAYYFKLIVDRSTLTWLSGVRGQSSAPIACAPMAVAICADPRLSARVEQDGCIGAYHFLLAARYFGLGTCWIAALNRPDVKHRLHVPVDHYVATVTPLGFPAGEMMTAPERHERAWFIRA
jgi:nitroreductase